MRPNSCIKWSTFGSIRRPKWPSAIPTKSAPALPRAIPLTLILPTIRPSAAVRASATICWPVEETVKRSMSHFISQPPKKRPKISNPTDSSQGIKSLAFSDAKGDGVSFVELLGEKFPEGALPLVFRKIKVRAELAEHGDIQRFFAREPGNIDVLRGEQNAALLEERDVHRNLILREHHQVIRLAFRNHRAFHLVAEPHVARNRAAALTHAVNFALFHIVAEFKHEFREHVARLDHARTAEAREFNVHRLHYLASFAAFSAFSLFAFSHARMLLSARRQGLFATISVSSSFSRASFTAVFIPSGSLTGFTITTFSMPAAFAISP